MSQESELPLEANEADAIEQSQPVDPESTPEQTSGAPLEADDADVAEQADPVNDEADAYPHDADSGDSA
ncbi:hypothetical protein IA539_01905 [Gordonia sp. zg691]|uniref:hypothetical protein n=1 Tax=Gordonia jinghuaiqii TaxID=2758710 RepID=UPI0016623FCE|nr:hypothetical protein [Gordonia jinghuaiqii]MBD0859966.1 hypothetical protein [Gordonia jinghuaiqii]